jgi:hypothetical protein
MTVIIILFMLEKACTSDGCSDVRSTFGASSYEYQQCLNSSSSGSSYRSGYGGSYGGYSSGGGGGHK